MRQIFEHDPLLGFRFVPNNKVRRTHEGGGYLIRSNALGYRSEREFSKDSTAKRRALVFGDSFTAGDGVSNNKRWTDRLEALIPQSEVFNFGLPGTGTDQHFLSHRRDASEVERDLVVIAVYVENVRRVGARFRWFVDESGENVLYAKPWFALGATGLELNGTPVPKGPVDPDFLAEEDRAYVATPVRYDRLKGAYNQLRASKSAERFVSQGMVDKALRLSRYQPVPEYDDEQHPAWLVLRQILIDWVSEARAPVAIIPIPIRHHIAGLADSGNYRSRFREAATAAGAVLLDPLEGLAGRADKEIGGFFFPHDGHFTASGHAALAEVIAPGIGELLNRTRRDIAGAARREPV